jgi:hypothetical protein
MAEPASRPELLPHLQLDELLAELQGRLQAVLATRDRMRGLLEAVVAIGSGLDLESTSGGSSRPRSAWSTRPTAHSVSSATTTAGNGGWPSSSRSA